MSIFFPNSNENYLIGDPPGDGHWSCPVVLQIDPSRAYFRIKFIYRNIGPFENKLQNHLLGNPQPLTLYIPSFNFAPRPFPHHAFNASVEEHSRPFSLIT